MKLSELDNNKKTRSENIKELKTYVENKLDKIEEDLEIEIQDVLQDYKIKEKQKHFNSKDPPD